MWWSTQRAKGAQARSRSGRVEDAQPWWSWRYGIWEGDCMKLHLRKEKLLKLIILFHGLPVLSFCSDALVLWAEESTSKMWVGTVKRQWQWDCLPPASAVKRFTSLISIYTHTISACRQRQLSAPRKVARELQKEWQGSQVDLGWRVSIREEWMVLQCAYTCVVKLLELPFFLWTSSCGSLVSSVYSSWYPLHTLKQSSFNWWINLMSTLKNPPPFQCKIGTKEVIRITFMWPTLQ